MNSTLHEEYKTCVACGEQKPTSRFSLRVDTRKPKSWCKGCTNLYARTWYERNREEIARKTRERKRLTPGFTRLKNQRRRALLASVPSERYSLSEVPEVTHCALCGGLLDYGLEYPDPLSKSLDHVQPLSLGGADVLANVRWTHLVCNTARGNRS